jgi:MarR family transcriptional regulator, lower aerobic nicotinate degradation pathway regulator
VHYNKATHFFSDGDKDHDLFMFLSRARYLAYRARERELQRFGLTPEQVGILFVIKASEEKLSPADIARLFLLQRHTISSMVERMEEKGLVKRNPDPQNKNRLILSITEKGNASFRLSTKREPVHRIMQTLEASERAVFIQCLEKIAAAASKELSLEENSLPSKTKKK